MEDRTGQQFGEYRLTHLLGKGGFGDVYLGEHVHEHTLAAVKVLKNRLTNEKDLQEFVNEARSFRLKHPHIVQLLDFGIGDEGLPFLVMDYAPNGTLRQRHPKGTSVPLDLIVSYVRQVASALQYAHDKRLVHRDVKPENMLLDQHNKIVLSDFGIALMVQTSLNQSIQKVAGTAAYMAPEQFQGKPRPASDQYAVGIVVYEWLTGDRPFHGSFPEMASQHMLVPPPPLREKSATIPPAVEEVVLTALAKDPKQRFSKIEAFAVALEVASKTIQNTSRSSVSTMPPTLPPPLAQIVPLEQGGQAAPFITRPPAVQPSVSRQPLNNTPGDAMLISPVLPQAAPATPQIEQANPSPMLQPAIVVPQNRHRKVSFKAKLTMVLLVFLIVALVGAGVTYTAISTSNAHLQATATAATLQARTDATATATAAINAYDTAATTKGVMFGFDPQHTHVNPYEHILNPTNVSKLVQAWSYPTGDPIDASPAVADGIVYIVADNCKLYALDARTGTKRWIVPLSCGAGPSSSSPAVVNGVVYIGSEGGTVYALDAKSGTQLWAYNTRVPDDFFQSSPTVVKGVVYIASGSDTVYALDAKSGTQLWAYNPGIPHNTFYGSPAVADGIVYIGSYFALLYALDAKTGTKLWVYNARNPILTSPTVANGVVYIGSGYNGSGTLYALNARSGTKLWADEIGISYTPAVANGIIYVTGNAFYALDAKSGTKLWTYNYKIQDLLGFASPSIANGIVYVGLDNNMFYALDAKSGTKLWTHKISGLCCNYGDGNTSAAVANGVVYIGGSQMYAFSLPPAS